MKNKHFFMMLIIALLTLKSTAQKDLLETVADYQGFEEGVFLFENELGDTFEFADCNPEMISKFELKSSEYISFTFVIKYSAIKDDGEEYLFLNSLSIYFPDDEFEIEEE